MKKTFDGDVVGEVGERSQEHSKQSQDNLIDCSADESRTNDAGDESFNSKSSDTDRAIIDITSEEERTSQSSPEDCKEKNISKPFKGEDNKGNVMETENVSPEPERRSSRLRGKRPKLTEIITTSDEEEYGLDDVYGRKDKDRKKGKKSILAKYMQKTHTKGKQKKSPSSETRRKDRRRDSRSSKRNDDSALKPPKEFTSGAFVVLKADYHSSTTPPIWKIDGKALLQKYLHFEEGGEILYKNTSTYSGWTSNNKDQYYPAAVELKSQNRQETIVRFDREAVLVEESD